MSEDTPTCRINEKNSWIKCANPAMPGDHDVLCLFHSMDKQKDSEGSFTDAIKEKLDRKENNFCGVFFPIKADFSGHEFHEAADFSSAIFSAEADFRHSTFSGGASFSACAFCQKADFTSVTIPENETVHFRGTDFAEKKEVIFRGAKVFGNLLFEQINLPDDKTKNRSWQGDFMRINLGPSAILRFRDTSLAFVRFEGTDINRIEFEGVEWYTLGWRQAIYDEIILKEKDREHFSYVMSNTSYLAHVSPRVLVLKDVRYPFYSGYPLVEGLYRKLKLNYENSGDHKNAGYFHYGEMEMHRKASPWRQWFSWYFIYWALSGYGECSRLALSWLAGFLLALPLLVWGVGLDRVAGGTSPGFLETFTYIFEKATFQRPPLLSNLNLMGRFISNLSLLIIPGQAALFLLALRNRLGRRR